MKTYRILFLRNAIALAAACIIASCTAIRSFQVVDATHNLAGPSNAYGHAVVVRTSVWISKNNKDSICDCEHGISRFKVTTKPGDVFLGFLTAGFRVRQRVEWDCSQRMSAPDSM